MPLAKSKPAPSLDTRILTVRGQQVLLDADLADIYQVPTKVFNQAVKRNAARFPANFAFRLSAAEKKEVVTNCDHLTRLKFSPVLPMAFTEHGALMAATILNSDAAIKVSVAVIEAFVRLRHMALLNAELSARLLELERKLEGHDDDLRTVFETLHQLMDPPTPPRRQIGFQP